MFEKIFQYRRDYENKIKLSQTWLKKVYVRARKLFKFFLLRILMKRISCIFKNNNERLLKKRKM